MALTDYTTYAEVRAVLGVDEDELKDEVISLDVFSFGLTADLKDINATLPTQFATVSNKTEADRSEVEQQFFEVTKSFATYAAAKQLLSGLPMFGPKDISDSKTLASRFSDSPYKETANRVEKLYELNRARLVVAFGAVTVAVDKVQRKLVVVSNPSIDRVTG
jgi:hypothetical protein